VRERERETYKEAKAGKGAGKFIERDLRRITTTIQ
jgi:hypothetical protein